MGCHVNGDDGPGGFPPHYCKTDCRDDGVEGRCRGMGVGLSGRGAGGDRDLADEGVRAEASGNNCGVIYREENLRDVYRGGEDVGIKQVPQVVVPRTRPHTGGYGGRAKWK